MRKSCIQSITLDYSGNPPPSSMTNERERAVADLCAEGFVKLPANDLPPYQVGLSIENKQFVMQLKHTNGTQAQSFILSLSPYRGLIKDYFMMIESYEQVRAAGQHEKLEPIDMARRGLHNEAADMIVERLKDKLEMDHATARRFFTLICVLHMSQTRFWQG